MMKREGRSRRNNADLILEQVKREERGEVGESSHNTALLA